ncbi:unnamed protein product, partial [Meganyctiphanes norvegica]
EEDSIVRKSAILVCRELRGSHTFDVIAGEIASVHQRFNIQAKVVSTTTDNARNFVKAFSVFSGDNDLLPIEPEEVSEPDDADPESDDDQNNDENDDVDIRDLHEGLLLLSDQVAEDVMLPKHRRCAAHTLNLVATTDLKKVPAWSHRKSFKNTLKKCTDLWRKQNMSSAISNKIKTELGSKLPYPSKVRWNSLYDSLKHMSNIFTGEDKEKVRKLHALMDNVTGLDPFTAQDIDIIVEYVTVMTPIAMALDILQSEEYAY